MLGLGDVAGGITNVAARPLGEITQKVIDGGGDAAFDWSVFNPIKTLKEGRRDFVNEQKDFAKEHPVLNLSGELIGGVIPAFLTAVTRSSFPSASLSFAQEIGQAPSSRL